MGNMGNFGTSGILDSTAYNLPMIYPRGGVSVFDLSVISNEQVCENVLGPERECDFKAKLEVIKIINLF